MCHERTLATPNTLGIVLVFAVLVVNAGLTYRALEAAKGFRSDMVLLDIGLPGMSGYDVAHTMRQMPEVKDAVLVA